MYCRVIACDFDGTSATDGHPAPELYAALAAARTQGILTLLATGRVLEDVQRACEGESPFDAVVAENGAVVCLCGVGRIIQLGKPPTEKFLGALRAEGIPFHTGSVIVGTGEQHAKPLLDLIRRIGIDGQLIFNRAALMVLPSGINKATGIRCALAALGRSERNMVAFGDAENDIPMLMSAEVGVAARGSIPSVMASADDRISQPGGAGVALYIRRLLDGGGTLPTPPRRTIALGKSSSGKIAALPTSGVNFVVSGDPRSGKSWIAGLIAEQLLEQNYRICVIDPEGDHAQLGQRPGIVTFGQDLAVPTPHAAAKLIASEPLSLILGLSSLAPREQVNYVDQLLAALQETRSATGIPHWVLIDEAHYFFYASSPCIKHLESQTGSFGLITYRTSILAAEVFNHISAHIITSTKVEEERYFTTRILQAHGRPDLVAHAALDGIKGSWAGLLQTASPESPWQIFLPADRTTRHAHHARKYADTTLSDDKAFRFVGAGTSMMVRNMLEFRNAIQTAPLASLRHHLAAGDFSRWVGEVIGDQQLAKGLRKLERAAPSGANPDRAEILAHINDHYLIQEE